MKSPSDTLVKNLEALGLPLSSGSRPPTPLSRQSYTTADSSLDAEVDEDGRPTTPDRLPQLPKLDETLELVAYPNARAAVEALRRFSRCWRMNCVLGPAAAEVRHELAELADRRHSHEVQDRHSQPHVRIWLAIWAGQGPDRRLEIVLSKIGQGPVVLGSPLDVDKISPATWQHCLTLLAGRLRQLLPDSVPTPGGGTEETHGTPLTNAHSVVGPALLSKIFASVWLGISPPPTDDNMPASIRAYGYSLAHFPCRIAMPATSLQDLIVVRLATDTDDLVTLASMYEDYASTTSTPVDRAMARRIVKSSVAAGHMWIYYVESATSPSISLVAGFLTLGSETATSIAITALYTGEIYRNKGVGEALLRSACRASIEKPRPGKTSVIALIPDATVARRMSMSANPSRNPNPADEIKPPVAVRLFARLGFRISQYEEQSLVGDIDGVEANEGQAEAFHTAFVATPPLTTDSLPPLIVDGDGPKTPVDIPGYTSRRSWEHWTELSFDGVTKGSSWSA